MVLAGGEGKRLMPLTADRAKPAVPFGGLYRMVDFALSNLVNAGYLKIVVLTQYKSHSLDRHITKTWRMSNLLGNYVTPVPAQQRLGPVLVRRLGRRDPPELQPHQRRAARLRHRLRRRPHLPDGPEQMVGQHIESGAGVHRGRRSASRSAQADQFGVIESATDGRQIQAFREKPTDAQGLPDAPDEIYASMGNYVFTTDALLDALHQRREGPGEQARHGRQHHPDAGRPRRGAASTTSGDNHVPGSTERDRGYWRDVGTLDSFYEAHMDLIAIHPVFNLYNYEWPIYTENRPLAAGQVRARLAGAARPGDRLDGVAAARSSPGRWWRTRSSRRTCGCTRGPTSRARC